MGVSSSGIVRSLIYGIGYYGQGCQATFAEPGRYFAITIDLMLDAVDYFVSSNICYNVVVYTSWELLEPFDQMSNFM